MDDITDTPTAQPTTNMLVVADKRSEDETCQRGTEGCCNDHDKSTGIWTSRCERW
jgi:hypothetical protein